MNYDPTNAGGTGFNPFSMGGPTDYAKEQSFIQKVFNWMFLGLGASGITAYIVGTNETLMMALYSNQLLFWGLAIGLLLMVWNLSANAHKMSPASAATNFFIYSALNGVLLSYIFAVYTASSIFATFCAAAALFGAMALYGATTKKDLSSWGSLLFMGLIGLIIAQVVNMFLHNQGFATILTYAGILLFVALTAYDMQRIKQIGQQAGYNPNMSILGALILYLDFINLFIRLLQLMGRRK